METIHTEKEVAELLKFSKSKMYHLVQRGDIPRVMINRNVRILESDLIKWLEEKRKRTRELGF